MLLQEDAYNKLQRTLMYSILDSSLSVLNCSPRGRDVATGGGVVRDGTPPIFVLA